MTPKSLTERFQERVLAYGAFPILGGIVAGAMGYPVEDVLLVIGAVIIPTFFVGSAVTSVLDARRASVQERRIAPVAAAASEQIDAAVDAVRTLWKHQHTPEDLDAAIRVALASSLQKLR